MIPYGRQDVSEEDIAAVAAVLRSDFLTQGPAVPAFEQAVAQYCGTGYAVAVSSATAALHVACLALGVGPGDVVWTSPITFVASANCALYCGAEIDFVDINPRTYNISIDRLAAKLELADKAGRLPKVVIPVHLGGQSCDMVALQELSRHYGFRILEDASHAIGAAFHEEPVGTCRYSDITVFSFHPVKIVTTAEGGMALTNDGALAETMALLRTHGITRDAGRMEEESHGPWYYEQLQLGFNYRMTDLQAALGTSQMGRLDQFVARRRAIAAEFDAAFVNEPIEVQSQEPGTKSCYHLYIIRLSGADAERHKAAFLELRSRGLGVNLHYMPVYLQPHYRRLGFQPGYCPASEDYYREAVSIPLYPAMSDEDVGAVIKAVKEVARR